MFYGICDVGVAPLRIDPSDKSEMISQLLYGEHVMILKANKNWAYIRAALDSYEGFVDKKQLREMDQSTFVAIEGAPKSYVLNLFEIVTDDIKGYMPIPMGAVISNAHILGQKVELSTPKQETNLVNTALAYLNAPYLWGGKTPLGIDCSGFMQMVYRLNNIALYRDTSEQVKQGTPLSFVEESMPGDLAFFGEGNKITHVGMLLEGNNIIHAHGRVRIDKLDQTGIFNEDTKQYTHYLKVIKRL